MSLIPLDQVKTRMVAREGNSTRRRLPGWFKVSVKRGIRFQEIQRILQTKGLHTICEEARCPNIWECWNNRTATFLILGDVCTRRCHYCSVTTGRPERVDSEEPGRVAEAVKALELRHAVITSVNRDDLIDGGASVFSQTIKAIREGIPTCTIEVLVPDFQGHRIPIEMVLNAAPEIFNHNIETVPRLFPAVRPQGKYDRSLRVLRWAKQHGAQTKSGLMVGMGESRDEVMSVLRDLREVGCDILSIGQYLQPTKEHRDVHRYYELEEFEDMKQWGMNLGFRHVESGPLVRSSYHAEQQAATCDR